MNFTDIFIKRPVLSTVVSALILVLGLRSMMSLPVMQYPFVQTAVVTISTTYIGADPEVIAGFITTPLENAIAQASGIDYMTSTSQLSSSTIQANLKLNYDPDVALNEINTKVNSVLNQLPKNSQVPVLSVAVGETIDSMYIGFYSDVLPRNKISDYIIRAVQPKLQSISGVKQAEIIGERKIALRAWLDPQKLAGYNLTAGDVYNILGQNNFISASGRTDGNMVTLNLTANTNLVSVEEFKNLVIKYENGALIRLKDVATVSLGSQNYNSSVSFDGKDAIYVGIKVAPSANVLSVIDDVRTAFVPIKEQLPEGLSAKIVYDASLFINSSINEVIDSLLEAIIIVTLVVFAFLGSLRAVTIPTVTIPLSLIGTFFIMLLLGYTINLLTLLALVLAIGLVVDDAIIVVENVYRHMEEGKSPKEAAFLSVRELTNPIIAISVVLIAVYLPIGFMEGLTGALFTEFAFTLAGSVAISAIIALTLSPMMCSKMLKPYSEQGGKGRFIEFVDYYFDKLSEYYHEKLIDVLNYKAVTGVFCVLIFISLFFLYITSKTELAPQEDQGIIISQLSAAPNASLYQTSLYTQEFYKIISTFPETDHVFQINGSGGLNVGIAGMVLKPWEDRKRSADQLMQPVNQALSHIAGAKIATFQKSPLPGSGSGLPIQFVLLTTDPFERLNTVTLAFMEKALAAGIFAYIDQDLKFDKVEGHIQIDRDKAANLGLTMQQIGGVLSGALSENYVNYFDLEGRSYQVIAQVDRKDRLNYDQIKNYYIRAANGQSVPLSTLVNISTSVVPRSLNHFQQLNSATISAVAAPGVTMGAAVKQLNAIAQEVLPSGYTVDYGGEARQYEQESNKLLITFVFALIIIFLSLSALFESFRDPIIVLISVPMSMFGALIFINLGLGGVSLNIYTEVGLVTLIGLISKHGILIVQFANDLQEEGKSKYEAILSAAAIRLRPILMTTFAMVLGVTPLILATGAGAASRFNIGLVIATGIAIGTLFTLFVVPTLYLVLAKTHQRQENASEI